MGHGKYKRSEVQASVLRFISDLGLSLGSLSYQTGIITHFSHGCGMTELVSSTQKTPVHSIPLQDWSALRPAGKGKCLLLVYTAPDCGTFRDLTLDSSSVVCLPVL